MKIKFFAFGDHIQEFLDGTHKFLVCHWVNDTRSAQPMTEIEIDTTLFTVTKGMLSLDCVTIRRRVA